MVAGQLFAGSVVSSLYGIVFVGIGVGGKFEEESGGSGPKKKFFRYILTLKSSHNVIQFQEGLARKLHSRLSNKLNIKKKKNSGTA